MNKGKIKSEIGISEFTENLIDTVREPLLVLDQDLRVVKASRSFYDYFKVNPAETIGKLIYNLGNDQWDIPKLRELLESILPEKTTFDNYEVEHDFATIGKRIMLLNARQIERALGKDKLILLAIEDITDRKLLENLLTESEERFRRIFETADDGILLLEKGGFTIRYANPSITKLSGFSIEECIGGKLSEIGFPADLKTSQEILQTLDTNGIFHYKDAVISNKNGQFNDVDIYMVNKTNLVQCNIRDITERKQAEEQIRFQADIIDNSPIIAAYHDKELNMVWANKAYQKATGLSLEEIKGRKCYQVWNLSKPCSGCPVITAMETGENAAHELTPDNQEHWPETQGYWLSQAAPVRDNQGAIISAIEFAVDITERKQAEKALLAKVDELERFFKLTVGREITMVALKKEVNSLLNKLGQDNKYTRHE